MLDRRRSGHEEVFNEVTELRNAVGAVDGHSKMRARVQALRVPGAECPQLVDDPALVTSCGHDCLRHARRDVTKALLLVFALIEKEIDVIEQELTSLLHRHRPGSPACDKVCGLSKNPRIAKDPATDEHAFNA